MSEPIQTRENHVKYDPMFHYLLMPVTLGLLIWSLVHLYHEPTTASVLISAALFMLLLLVFKVRIYSLKVQDRVIRLEERLRLQSLGSSAGEQLTEGQLIALRFASDAEAPALATTALNEQLKAKEIKARVKNWRGDYFRV